MKVVNVENPIITFNELTVVYEDKPAVWNVSYTLPEGKLIGIMGPNGSGKSTSMKALMGLLKPANGKTSIYGKTLDEVRNRVAYVPQRGAVDWDFPASVLDTVLMGRYKPNNIFSKTTSLDKDIALECIRKVKMEEFVDRQIAQLSGGQQQRVFIARALAQEADLYLLDEPFAGVDAATESAVMDILNEMIAEGKTVVVVHHDLQTAPQYFDWLVLMNTRLVASGPIEEVYNQDLLNDAFGGRLNILVEVDEIIRKTKHPVREK